MRGIIVTLAFLLADAFTKSENGYRFLEHFEHDFDANVLGSLPKEWKKVRIEISVEKADPSPLHEGYIHNRVADTFKK
jgi:hypothetical protein